jgi:Flp pilus assembly protein TadG
MMIIAAVMPMLVGAGAVGIDVAHWTLTKRHLQRAADTGALAGAHAVLMKDPAKPAVDRSLNHNDQVTISTLLVENAPTAGAYTGDALAVRVVVSATPQLPFVSFFMSGPTTISAEATAAARPH